MENNQTSILDQEQTTIPSQEENEKKLSKAIMLAVELEGTFKLYSYRIITPDQYQERVNDLVNFYKSKS